MDQHALDSFLCGLSWPSMGILTTYEFYTQHSHNCNRNVGMEMEKIWTSNVYNIFLRSSRLPFAIETCLELPKHSSI